MKAKLVVPLFFAIVIVGLMFIAGCTRINDVHQNTTKTDFNITFDAESALLLNSLQEFNLEFMSTQTITRGEKLEKIWKKTKQVLYVSTGDLIGAYQGARLGAQAAPYFGPQVGTAIIVASGLVTGVAGSVDAYRDYAKKYQGSSTCCASLSFDWNKIYESPYYVYENMVDITEAEIQREIAAANVNMSFYSENPEYARIGIMHNIGLQKMIGENNITENRTTELKVIGGSDEEMMLKNPKFIAKYQDILKDINYFQQEFESVIGDSGINPSFNQITASPTAIEILDLFLDLYNNYYGALEDVDFIINFYADHIFESSALDGEEKNALLSSLAVAAYSPRFWVDKLPHFNHD